MAKKIHQGAKRKIFKFSFAFLLLCSTLGDNPSKADMIEDDVDYVAGRRIPNPIDRADDNLGNRFINAAKEEINNLAIAANRVAERAEAIFGDLEEGINRLPNRIVRAFNNIINRIEGTLKRLANRIGGFIARLLDRL